MSGYLFRAPDQTFVELRPRLFSIAYRMLGIRADAEDVVQDAWLRWQEAERDGLQSETAWLVTVTTRLAIDRLRHRQNEQPSYVGYWLPEPLVELDERTPESAAELASDVSVALLWVLERLAPEERAAFLLRQVFDEDYADLAAVLGRSEASCRQLVHRATGVYWSLEHEFPSKVVYRMATINGEPGLLRYVGGKLESVQSFTFVDGLIDSIYIVRNPDKLQGVPPLLAE